MHPTETRDRQTQRCGQTGEQAEAGGGEGGSELTRNHELLGGGWRLWGALLGAQGGVVRQDACEALLELGAQLIERDRG